MGGAASLFDSKTQLSLSHEQRKRYKSMYEQLLEKGWSDLKIKQELENLFKLELSPNLLSEPSLVRENKKSVKSERRASLVGENDLSTKLTKALISRRRITYDTEASKLLLKSPSVPKGETLQTEIVKSPSQLVLGDAALIHAEFINLSSRIAWKSDEVDKPFCCELCNSSFKLSSQLEQHVNYSYVHSKAVKRHEMTGRIVRASTVMHNVIRVLRQSHMVLTNEGKSRAWQRWKWAFEMIKHSNSIKTTAAYLIKHMDELDRRGKFSIKAPASLPQGKLIYEGHKFFWKSLIQSQEVMDVHMFVHDSSAETIKTARKSESTDSLDNPIINNENININSNYKEPLRLVGARGCVPQYSPNAIIEMIVFDSKKQKELPRLYFRYMPIFNIIKKTINKAITDAVLESIKKEGEAKPVPVVEYFSETGRRGKSDSGKSLRSKINPIDKKLNEDPKAIESVDLEGMTKSIFVEFVISKLELVATCHAAAGQMIRFVCDSNNMLRSPSTIECQDGEEFVSLKSVVVDYHSSHEDPLIKNSVDICSILHPAKVHRRRRSTEADINSTIREIKDHTTTIKSLTNAAQHHSSKIKPLPLVTMNHLYDIPNQQVSHHPNEDSENVSPVRRRRDASSLKVVPFNLYSSPHKPTILGKVDLNVDHHHLTRHAEHKKSMLF